jgi:DNA-binding MarR family transcriptional regulator
LAPQQITLTDLIEEMHISKSAASLLVETLVNRGYIVVVKDDGNKLEVTLTERGRAAAATQAAAREKIDTELLAAVGETDVNRTRRTLAVLIDIGRPVDHVEKL